MFAISNKDKVFGLKKFSFRRVQSYFVDQWFFFQKLI